MMVVSTLFFFFLPRGGGCLNNWTSHFGMGGWGLNTHIPTNYLKIIQSNWISMRKKNVVISVSFVSTALFTEIESPVSQPFKLVGELVEVDMWSAADISPLKVTCGSR